MITAQIRRAEVFVSYSSADRSRVLPFVDSLIARGIRVWIDRYQIPGGSQYTQEIPVAIGNSKAIALFASESAFKSHNVRRELDIAWKKQKPVLPLFLDKTEVPESFEWYLESIQFVFLHELPLEQWLDKTCDPLKRLGVGVDPSNDSPEDDWHGVPPEDGHGAGNASIGVLTPYLVNRIHQERHLRQALLRHSERVPRRPIVLIAHGQIEQAIHEYIERVQHDSLPKALKHVGYPDFVKWVHLPWTTDDLEKDPPSAIRGFQNDLELELELRPNSMPAGLVERLTTFRSTVVLCYRASCQSWTATHISALKAYVQTWACLPELSPGYPLIVLFAFQYPSPQQSWLDRLNRFKSRPLSLPSEMLTLNQLDSPNLAVSVLPPLGNVLFTDIEHWIREYLKPPDPVRTIRKIREILNDPELIAGPGIPMSRLVDRLYTIVENIAKEQMI